jgi:hypothetical protein
MHQRLQIKCDKYFWLGGVLKLEPSVLKECAILNRGQGFLTKSTIAIINTSPLGTKRRKSNSTSWGENHVVQTNLKIQI